MDLPQLPYIISGIIAVFVGTVWVIGTLYDLTQTGEFGRRERMIWGGLYTLAFVVFPIGTAVLLVDSRTILVGNVVSYVLEGYLMVSLIQHIETFDFKFNPVTEGREYLSSERKGFNIFTALEKYTSLIMPLFILNFLLVAEIQLIASKAMSGADIPNQLFAFIPAYLLSVSFSTFLVGFQEREEPLIMISTEDGDQIDGHMVNQRNGYYIHRKNFNKVFVPEDKVSRLDFLDEIAGV